MEFFAEAYNWLRGWPWVIPCLCVAVGVVCLLVGWWKRSRPRRRLTQDEKHALWLVIGIALVLLGVVLAIALWLQHLVSGLL